MSSDQREPRMDKKQKPAKVAPSNKKYRRGLNAPSLRERIQQKISVDAATGCWLWRGAKQKSGHGCMTVNSAPRGAHRVSYEIAKGQIPPGLDLDHLCRNPSCVNPDHLEPVTRKENLLRGNTIPARHAAKTHCINGHAFIDDNISRSEGFRRCKACKRILSSKRYQEREALHV